MFKHLFFDLDHTLWDFDTNSILALKQVYDRFDLKQKGIEDFKEFEKKYHAHNNKLWDRFRKGFINRETLRWKRYWLTLLDYKIADEKLSNQLSDLYLELLPLQTALVANALEVLEFCKANNFNLHIMTNGFENTQIQKLKNAGISHFFNHIITSEAAMALKPKKEIYEYAEKMTGSNIANSLMIGDSLEADILGAINAGWKSVYYNPHQINHEMKPTFEISTLSTLIQILN